LIYYFDSSVIVKRYIEEKGTSGVRAIICPPLINIIHISTITAVEVVAALSRRYRIKEISENCYKDTVNMFLQDSKIQYYSNNVSEEVIDEAIKLAKSFPLRAYDAIQLATALMINTEYKRRGVAELTFVSSDRNLCKVAVDNRLQVINPEET